jgi:hypothetical protein
MVAEHRRSGFVVWVLIGLVVVLVMGTAGAVALPVFRCMNCRVGFPAPDQPPVRRVRVDGKFVVTDRPCDWCNNRMKMTGLSCLIYAAQRSRR